MHVEETELVERPCPDGCGGTERRAFGEFESRRGELASYAFGWTSGHEDLVGRMTVGIGVGNEGGGSFHFDVLVADGRGSTALVDEPFETVAQGGPDLSAEQARAHEDLDFVHMVVDYVMLEDRRARWMEHWLAATGALVDDGVLRREAPVMHVVRPLDADDLASWHLLSGQPGAEDEAHLWHLWHAIDHDPSLIEILDLEPGQRADRDNRRRRWKRSRAG